MLDIQEVTNMVNKLIPDCKIQAIIPYKNLYLMQIFTDDPFEGELDPFYSIDRKTGEFRDFSIITTPDRAEIVSLFMKAKSTGSKGGL